MAHMDCGVGLFSLDPHAGLGVLHLSVQVPNYDGMQKVPTAIIGIGFVLGTSHLFNWVLGRPFAN